MRPQKMERMKEIIREEVASRLLTSDDPDLRLVNVFDVDVTQDLSIARIYFSTLGNVPLDKLEAKLRRFARRIQGDISRRHRFRVTPRFEFIYSDALKRGSRVVELLDMLSKKEHRSEEDDDGGQAE